MKRFILFLAAILCSLSSFALTFEGVEMKGTAEDFVSALKAKGFTIGNKDIDNNYGSSLISWHGKGTVLGRENQKITITSQNGSSRIKRILVYCPFPRLHLTHNIHDHFLAELTKKYGKPKFSYDYRTSTNKDRKKIPSYRKNDFFMYHIWKLKNGDEVTLLVTSDSTTALCIHFTVK